MAASQIGAAPTTDLTVEIAELRSVRGVVQVCLTRDASRFPNCKEDPAARRLKVPASAKLILQIEGISPGGYALSAIHDENANGRLDKFGIVPREGFGFSRNPAIGFGPPSFNQAEFAIGGGKASQTIRMRYLL